jgi:hypothetical protein
LSGNYFSISGIVYEVVSVGPLDDNGNQTETISFSGTFSGAGSLVDSSGNINPAVFSGTLSGHGSGPFGS